MSRDVTTAEMADEAIQDLTWMYGPMGNHKKGKKKGGNIRLHPLESASPIISHSADSLTRRRNLNDVHYVSHLHHKAANVNREPVAPQKKSPTKLANLSTEDIAQHIEEVQLQVLQESEILKKITSTITVQYSALDEVAKTILTHRKELAAKIEEINQNYVDLFEHMLSEIMRIQRAKFKSQTNVIEELKAKLDSVEGKLYLEREKAEMLEKDKAKLQEKLMHSEADNRSLKYQVESLQRQIEVHIEDKERIITESHKMMSKFKEEELVATIENMRQTFKHQLQTEKTRHGEDMSKLRRVVEEKDGTIEKIQKELDKKIAERNQIFRQLEEARFRRPQVDGSSQTQVTEEGLWDQQDGWILPISSTTLARNRWRKVINFARCPSCKGNNRFIAQAAALFKKVTTGTAPAGLLEDDAITEETTMKWVIPDNLTAFLTNLPKTVQGWNPHNLAWTVKMAYLLLDFRSIVDDEDRKLGYHIENFMDYTIETFLRTVENRSQAELNLYQFVRSLREHHGRQHLLHLVARCLHLSAALSKEERQKVLDLRTRGELALKRKRKAQMQEMKVRDKLKVIAEKERESEDNVTVQAQESANERDFVVREDILSKEILAAVLFVRKCLYAVPYRGVYKKLIWQVKEACGKYSDFEKSLAKTKEQLWPAGSPAVHIPSHVLFNAQDKYQCYLPADRVVRVLRPLLSSCDPAEVLGIYRAMESHCMILHSDGKISMPEGMHSFVRSTLRLFIYAESVDGADIETWQSLKDKYNHHVDSLQKYRNGSEPKHKKEIILHEDTEKFTLIVDIDYVLLLVAEIWRRKSEQVDADLKRTFELGDVNHDNVLSYTEFRTIVQRVYKGCEERKVLRMFREALLLGNDKDTIGPQAFLTVCKDYDLVNMMDFSSLEWGAYKALLHPEPDKVISQAKGSSKAKAVVLTDELDEEDKGKELHKWQEVAVQTAETSLVHDASDVEEDEDYANGDYEKITLDKLDQVAHPMTASIVQKKRIRHKQKFPSINPYNYKEGRLPRDSEGENSLNSPPPTISLGPPGPLQPPIHATLVGGLEVSVGQKPLTYPPQKVNVVRSKEYAEQVQRELLMRKMQRMQGI